mmetsp:Transcript_31093/g.68057  ORF Transcript_31093/g.68057 Transcript_31093/m.68057 type:complete len:764 (+) Transcript_31093:53-2344(+)
MERAFAEAGARKQVLATASLFALVLAVVCPIASSQTEYDVKTVMARHPGCFHKNFQYTPSIPGTNVQARNVKDCMFKCRLEVPGCVVFAYWPLTHDCYFGDSSARLVESSTGALAGYGKCPEPTSEPPASCRTELPNNGFPGVSRNASMMAWPSGKQPWTLDCWPKNWTGRYISCQQTTVLEDTATGWPGKCHKLVKQARMKNATKEECQQSCLQNPLCPSWQLVAGGKKKGCWQGGGINCYIRENWAPAAAQRIQHGMVRKLMDLAGWQIVGLYKVFDNSQGYFLHESDAIAGCKMACYSDIRCQYWQYAPDYGCFVEAASMEFQPPYPLTLEWAYRSTPFALNCIAGEYIQHYCPESMTTAFPTARPRLSRCMETGFRWEPLNMILSYRTVEMNAAACRKRCRKTENCYHFAFWPDGGCNLQDSSAHKMTAEDYRVVSGPPSCALATPKPAPDRGWLTPEGEAALNGHAHPGSSPGAPPGAIPATPGASAFAGSGGAAAPVPTPAAVVRTTHFAELMVTIENLDFLRIKAPEMVKLNREFVGFLSGSLGVPPTEIQDEPYGETGHVDLHPRPPLATLLTAFVPLSGGNTKRIEGILMSAGVETMLKNITSKIAPGAIVGKLALTEHTVTEVVPDEDVVRATCTGWCRWWPMILLFLGIVCGGGVIAGVVFAQPRQQKRGVNGSFPDRDESLEEESEGDGDEAIWASEPAWNNGVGSSVPPPPPPGATHAEQDSLMANAYTQPPPDSFSRPPPYTKRPEYTV